MKTSDLTGPALDWAVAKCEGMRYYQLREGECFANRTNNRGAAKRYFPSTNWAQGGPIIEREKIDVENIEYLQGDPWGASTATCNQTGPTPLIAAMRCYVASKLDDEPKEQKS